MSAREPLAPAYVICGEDRATVDRALRRLIARVVDEGGLPPERLRADETPAADVVALCEALSFGGVRLVIVEGADAWRAGDAEPVVAYLGGPNPQTCLALVGDGPPPRPLVAAVEKVGRVLVYGPDPSLKGRKRTDWYVGHLERAVERAGGAIAPRAARRAVERVLVDRPDARTVGLPVLQLANEAEKLVAYADGARIDEGMVELLVDAHPDAKIWELADAIAGGEGGRAQEVLRDLASGAAPVDPVPLQARLAGALRRLATAQSGGDEDAVARATGARGYALTRLVEQARALPPGAGAAIVARAADLELDLRVSALRELGSPDAPKASEDGARLVLERGVRDMVALARGAAPGRGR